MIILLKKEAIGIIISSNFIMTPWGLEYIAD